MHEPTRIDFIFFKHHYQQLSFAKRLIYAAYMVWVYPVHLFLPSTTNVEADTAT
jgi:hypothetical protein